METVGAVFIDGGKMTDRSIETSRRITFLKHETSRLVIGIGQKLEGSVVGEMCIKSKSMICKFCSSHVVFSPPLIR